MHKQVRMDMITRKKNSPKVWTRCIPSKAACMSSNPQGFERRPFTTSSGHRPHDETDPPLIHVATEKTHRSN